MFRVARVTHRNALTRTSCATEFRTARTALTRRMLAVSIKLTLFSLLLDICASTVYSVQITRYCLATEIF